MDTEAIRICCGCSMHRPESDFVENGVLKKRPHAKCIHCRKLVNKGRWAKMSSQQRTRWALWRKEWSKRKRDHLRKKQRENYYKNIDFWRKRRATRTHIGLLTISEYNKQWRLKNLEKCRAISARSKRLSRLANIEKARAYQKEYKRNNPIPAALRLRLYKSTGASQHQSAILLLGISISDFRSYLESLFKPGMSWSNYGVKGWHIDHKKPCAMFDLTDPEQQKG